MQHPSDYATKAIHACTERSGHGELSQAIHLTQGFAYDSCAQAQARFNGEDEGYIYSRYGNPTVCAFERRMAELEGAEQGRAFASGMAAVTAALVSQLRAGDHLVASKALFGSCRWVCETFLPRMGVESTLIDGRDMDAWQAATRSNTRVFFLETPSNPSLQLVDIAAVAAFAKTRGICTVVDNVFATPLYQQPLALGADVVVYSATKHIDGQGRCLGGVVLGSADWVAEHLEPYIRHTGPSLSPFNAWTLLKGLETLPLRVRAQTDNAAALADALNGLPNVRQVIYPGRADHPQYELAERQMRRGSTLIAFEVEGGTSGAFAFADALRVITISNNLGDVKSLITHPGTTTHRNLSAADRLELGITDGLLRLSVGIEGIGDLTRDVERGAAAVG